MREVKAGKKIFKARPLAYGDFKELRRMSKAGGEDFDLIEFVFEKIFTANERKEIDRLPTPEIKAIYQAILDETIGAAGEEKNSSTSGPGRRTRSESDTAASAGT